MLAENGMLKAYVIMNVVWNDNIQEANVTKPETNHE